jgi:hypothetical protein
VLGGSVIGNRDLTQQMLDFCGQHNITADVEVSRYTPHAHTGTAAWVPTPRAHVVCAPRRTA